MQNFIELKFCILFYDEALHCIIYIEILEKIMKIKKKDIFICCGTLVANK
ncbi:hypothetical protein HMPREF9406_2310 [Clostridium sp. HGF2]|nr:hypothetical protein HMPREF9406_2310 [Clostridium sp. HGF2]EQJ61158.1 hypothetical protein QSI_1125 [Clostridioides difficile P28]